MWLRYAGLLGLALMVGACGPEDPTAIEPVVLTGTPSQTDTFSSSLSVGGTAVDNFTVTNGGQVNVTLVSAGPPPTIIVGMGLGMPSVGGGCTLLQSASVYANTSPVLALPLNAGQYCVAIYDVGNITATIQFIILIAHP